MSLTKTGKVQRRHAGGNHFLQKKSASRKRKFAGTESIGKSQSKSVRRRLGV
ncbi:MAG TPA: bL35 family ribosomal protein [Candidatus Saccharimonadales bacterium]|nr:bL35 family ribosomal protein [Candidatus Saccharimonadales bacterium]